MLKLKDDASEDVIEQAVIALADENEQLAEAKTKLETENTQLKDAAKAVQQAGIIALVDKAVEEKKNWCRFKRHLRKIGRGRF